MNYRPYDSDRDKHHALRIYQEVNWLQGDHADELDAYIRSGRGLVAELNGEAECLVTSSPGDLRYQEETLPFACITGVTTSRVARKQGFAAGVTAASVAHEAADGAAVVGLGMFEQGFYNRLGFGSGPYEHNCTLNPSTLMINAGFRVPERLTTADGEAIHACRLRRLRGHGSVSLRPAVFTVSRIAEYEGGGYGLGYRDEADGALSHLIWCTNDKAYHGPLQIRYLCYQTREQFLELLALLKSFGDQLYSISLGEPVGIQLQDLVRQPSAQDGISSGGPHKTRIGSHAWWQMRICDLPACLARTHLPGAPVRFNLELSDPVPAHLPAGVPWSGIGGEYVVTLGEESSAAPGNDPSLPTLQTTVNAFTRLWLGVQPATGLTYTDTIAGPPELLSALDTLIRLPRPRPDWDM